MADVLEITADNFQAVVLESERPVLVDFWAEWCGPCRIIAPVVEQIASERADSLVVGKLDVDKHGPIAARYGVQGIPVPGPVRARPADPTSRRCDAQGAAREAARTLGTNAKDQQMPTYDLACSDV